MKEQEKKGERNYVLSNDIKRMKSTNKELTNQENKPGKEIFVCSSH